VFADWSNALLNNGLANYQDAMAAAQRAVDNPELGNLPRWALVELIEAATRSGHSDIAADPFRRLAAATSASGTDWALGIEARSRALLTEGVATEPLYRESIERLDRTRVRIELARAHLLYGEWLRRERRIGDARDQLRIAHDMLEEMGMAGFAERARRELKATGATARKRAPGASDHRLTAQEAQIAHMAGDGLTNPERPGLACSSARAPSSTTCARSSPSLASIRATNSIESFPMGRPVLGYLSTSSARGARLGAM
jgi:hypothetical protein